MDKRNIETILAEHESLRRSIKNLESSIKSCDTNTISKMLDAKTELEILTKTRTINYNDWEIVNNILKDLGNKFTNDCICNIKTIAVPTLPKRPLFK